MAPITSSGILTYQTTASKWYDIMYENDMRPAGFGAAVKKYFSDPVLLYTVAIMMAIMYHYSNFGFIPFGLASFIITALLFKVFDFIMKHKIIGVAVYIALFVMLMGIVSMTVNLGYQLYDEYPLPFFVWFITPQAALDFNIWYTITIFLLFAFFMSSVVYYFTRAIYRVFMGFIVFWIPFAIYGKEAEQMPIPFIILLSMGYFVLMIYFRELREDDTIKVAAKRETWKSVGIFAIVFASAAAVIPKPKVTADRTMLEQMISADKYTDDLVAMLGLLRDSSSGGLYRNVNSDIPLYYALADEPLHLKTATYTTYNYSSDTWSAGGDDQKKVASYRRFPAEITQNGDLISAILTAAEADRSFAEKYGLTDFSLNDLTLPGKKEVTIYAAMENTQSAPVPQYTEALLDSSTKKGVDLLKTGIIRSKQRFEGAVSFKFRYAADTFFINQRNKAIIDALSGANNYELLKEASNILKEEFKYSDYEDEELERYIGVLDDERSASKDMTLFLDYGNKKRIYDLATEITEGLETDYDKAKAIELYFVKNGYVYDLEYAKSRGENAENFLFNTKRGVCYEYATSMVLLARAAGIPARYCEGFLMSDENNNDELGTNYIITPKSGHGYPELYINGAGWIYFEPTIYNGGGNKEKNSFLTMLMYSGFILFGILILIIASILIYPSLYHKIFISICRKGSPENRARAVMFRICRLYSIRDANTSHEAAAIVKSQSGADIYAAAKIFDAVVYGGASISEQDGEKCVLCYISAYDALKEKKKKSRKSKEISYDDK